MKLYTPLVLMLLATPALAQTTTTEGTITLDTDTINLSTRVGTAFYSDPEMTTLRSAEDVRVQWETISAEDQAALRARCENLPAANAEVTPAPGDSTGPATGDGAAADSAADMKTDMNFVADDTRMLLICDIIRTY